ncbi:UDP-N-acetylglucosamine 2-epimerase (non-hydrolyzing) [Candidatus Poribacteria bacterium]|nr:UDP-N-acetylglucosamine 2-epimerase (non-hydrolyzing) [Candidatus Poribacteria bacterium]
MKIACVVGARPNFMKIAPILEEMKAYPNLKPLLIHTGQHYDYTMSQVFFDELDIPKPDVFLNVGSGTHAVQTAKIMIEFDKVIAEHKPDMVLVVGDVNSTLACSLVSSKLWIPIVHVEAGIRSYDRTMPEEINRVLTDVISDYLMTPTEDANKNLAKEGISQEKVILVGDVMIDTLIKYKDKAISASSGIMQELGLEKASYVIMTLHRPSNVDIKENFAGILEALWEIQKHIKIVFPIHPRTKNRISEFGFSDKVSQMKNLIILEPLGYLKFMGLMINSKFALTDSGGMQTESTVINIPCLTMRENTERPETIREGTNTLVGNDTQTIISESMKILEGKGKKGTYPKIWDGHTARRIAEIINSRQ